MLQVAGRDPARLSSSDFVFIIGPRLNAAGRLDDISMGIQCLLTENSELAHDLATELDRLNQERRSIEATMQTNALQYLNDLVDEQDLPWGLCLYNEHWHQGVVGILASRIKERYHRPVIAFAREDEHTIKGSGALSLIYIFAMLWTVLLHNNHSYCISSVVMQWLQV